MKIAAEVSSLESMVESLSAENKTLNHSRVINECENAQLRLDNRRLQLERDQAFEVAAQLKIILDQVGAGIVHGMNRFNAMKRTAQEEQITAGDEKPLFLAEQQQAAE